MSTRERKRRKRGGQESEETEQRGQATGGAEATAAGAGFSDRFMVAMLWTCKVCGFTLEGGQPKYECPICESYKTSFVDLPQHLELQVREEHAALPANHATCRSRRLELMAAHQVTTQNRAAGRVLPAASGNGMNPSREWFGS